MLVLLCPCVCLQVCSLTPDQLHASSELQLQAWLCQQEDLQHEGGDTFTVRHVSHAQTSDRP